MTKEWQHVYLDTDHIQGYLWGKPDEQEIAKEIFRKLEGSLKNPLIEVKIPFLVAGELINNLHRADKKDKDYILAELPDLLEMLNADLVPPPDEAYNKAIELRSRDYRVERVDALIVSQALCDPYSSHLLTTDRILLHSRVIKNIEIDMRKHGERKRPLKITAEF